MDKTPFFWKYNEEKFMVLNKMWDKKRPNQKGGNERAEKIYF